MRSFKRSRFWSHLHRHPERRLQGMALLFLIAVAVPLYVLFNRVYTQLRQEALSQYRLQAEHAVRLMEDDITRLMTREANRPFADYGFFRVEEQKLLQTKELALSPLSQFPVSSHVPGLIGYFQISPDGILSSPVLPDITPVQFEAYNIQFSEAEYASRLALKNRLEHVLNTNRLSTSSKREDGSTQPKSRTSDVNAAPLNQPPSSSVPTASNTAKPAESEQKETDAASEASPTPADLDLRSTFRGTKLTDLNIDERLYRKQQSRLSPEALLADQSMSASSTAELRRQRTEHIDLPENQSIEAYRDFRKQQPSPSNAPAHQATQADQPLILSFEGEIDPFQFYVLQDFTFAFVRKAWKAKQRYIQGFLVDGKTFVQEVIQPRFRHSSIGSISRLVVSYHGEVLAQLNPAPNRHDRRRAPPVSRPSHGQSEVLIYAANLSTPFQDVTIHATMPSLPLGPGASMVHTLAVIMPAVLLAGVYGLYRLAFQQMKLAGAQQNFVSAVSHELKTPLTSIRMYGEMLRDGWVQDESKRRLYYDFIFSESERLSRLVANVLQMSQLTNTPSPLALKPCSPVVLLDSVQANVQAQVEAAGFTLNVNNRLSTEQNAAVQIEVDTDAFTRMMINLMDNALKFSAQADHKVVSLNLDMCDHPRPLVMFSVRDYGPGIDRQHRKKIFQRFYRAGSELTRTTPGTGIGLALVKELANRMHADVDFCNQKPGVAFYLRFQPVSPSSQPSTLKPSINAKLR